MKKITALFAALAVGAMTLTGCERSPEDQASLDAREKEQQEARIAFVKKREEGVLQKAEAEAKVCRINVDLRQSRFSLDPFAHAKDAINAAEFPLPVSCERMKTFSPNENIVDKFRKGSLFIDGSIGDWKMSVKDIPYVSEDADKTSCKVTMELSQSRFSLDVMQHIKDAINKVEFDWDLPGNVYHASKEGQDFAKDGFRVGSLLMRGSFGDWNLKLKKKNGCQPS